MKTRLLLLLVVAHYCVAAGILERKLNVLYYGDSFGGYVRSGISRVVNENFPAMQLASIGGHSANGWYVTQNYLNYWPMDKSSFASEKHKWIFFQDAGRVDPDFRPTMRLWVPEAIDSGYKLILTDNCDSASWYVSQNVASTYWQPDNAEIRSLASQYGQIYLPMAEIELAAIRRLGENAILSDGLHPNAHAAHLWAIALMKAWGADIRNLKFATTGCPVETTSVYVHVVDSVMNRVDPLYTKSPSDIAFQSSTANLKEYTTTFHPVYLHFADTAAEKNISGQAEWYSSDTSVITVSVTGKISAKKQGSAYIVAQYRTFSDTLVVDVSPETSAPESLSISELPATIFDGMNVKPVVTAFYSGGGSRNVSTLSLFVTTDSTVVRVENGIITGLAGGTVTVSVQYGGRTALKEITVVSRGERLLLVDFGTNENDNKFGTVGWNWVMKDDGTTYSAVPPGGMITDMGPTYNYQAVSGSPLMFSHGDKVVVTWRNLGYITERFTPLVSLNDPNRNGTSYAPVGTWSSMSEVVLPPNGIAEASFTISGSNVGLHSIVNVYGGYDKPLTLVCEKIEIIRGGRSMIATDAVLDSIRCFLNHDSVVVGDSLRLNVVGYFRSGSTTYLATIDSLVTLRSGNPDAVEFSFRTVKGLIQNQRVNIIAEYNGYSDTSAITVLARPSFIKRINFQRYGTAHKGGWFADSGARYSVSRGYGWSDRTVSDNRDDRAGMNFLLKSFVRTSTPVVYHIDAPDGQYAIRLGVGDNVYGKTALNTVQYAGESIIQYSGSPLIYDTVRGIFGLANGIAETSIVVTNGSGIDLTVNGALNYVVVCSREEGTPLHFISDDNVSFAGAAGGSVNAMVSNNQASGFGVDVYPNPFNPATQIHITGLSAGHKVLSSLYNCNGQIVLSESYFAKGREMQINFNAKTIAGGVYYLRVQNSNKILVKRLVFMK